MKTLTLIGASRLAELIERVAKFQEEKFPDQPLKGKLAHLAREVRELHKKPNDIFEWADTLILFIAALHSANIDLESVIIWAEEKMDINDARKWSRPARDGHIRHK